MNQVRASCWSVTINNPITADDENISLARQKGWKVEGQLEKGENGTPHYQLMVKTPQIRFSAIKKQFPRAHIEIAKNREALELYVHKVETREGELTVNQDAYPSLQKLWDLFTAWIERRDELLAKETWKPEKFLQRFDMFIEDAILDGFVVETMAVNPQIRSSIKNYGRAIVIRSINRRQTDRQTDENSVCTRENGENDQESTCTEESVQEETLWKKEVRISP